MPVVLSRNDYDIWLDTSIEEKDELLPLLVPCPDDELIYYPVNVRNQGEDCIEPIELPAN